LTVLFLWHTAAAFCTRKFDVLIDRSGKLAWRSYRSKEPAMYPVPPLSYTCTAAVKAKSKRKKKNPHSYHNKILYCTFYLWRGI